jgi:hypothetical protein
MAALLLTGLVAGCGGEKQVDVPAPGPSGAAPSPTTTSTAASFSMPSPGDEIGAQVGARPPDKESASGAASFAAWTLSLLMHTPRDEATTQLWNQSAGAGCDPCRKASGVWQEQVAKGQVFRYDKAPTFVRNVVRAQRQGDGWFVEYEVAVPRSTLRQGGRVIQSVAAEHLDYTFTMSWVDDGWRLEDFHVLG